MNLKNIAKLADVSVSTVSKAFADADDVSTKTKEKIFKIAKENGCYGKYCRDRYEKKVIAVICPEITSNYYCNLLEHLQENIRKEGGEIIISTDGFDPKRQLELIEYHASYSGADGIIVNNIASPLPKTFDVPIVSIGQSPHNSVDCLIVNTDVAVNDAIAELKSNGHRNIALITEPLAFSRVKQFESAMIENRLDPLQDNIFVSSSRFEEAGRQGIDELLKRGSDFTAVVCAYDYIALGAINRLDDLGLKVPDDISVISMMNNFLPSVSNRGISSIDSCLEETCEMACELIYKKFENRYYRSNKHIELIASFTDRGTVGTANLK